MNQETCEQCGKESPSVSQEHRWCSECLSDHQHSWVPQINGDALDIEACSECQDLREISHKQFSSRGGKARAKALSEERRKEIALAGGKARARKASQAREAKRKLLQ